MTALVPSLPFFALVRRELLTSLRKRRIFFAILAMIVIMGCFIVPEWPAEGGFYGAGASARQIFSIMIIVALFAEAIIIPAYTATAILSEREQETYDLLATTLIRPAGIVLGKFANGVGFFGIMLAAMLPVFAALFFLVGVQWRDFGLALAVMTGTALLCGGVGLYCSTRFRSPVVSVIFSYLGAAFLLGGWMVVVFPVLIVLDNWFDIDQYVEPLVDMSFAVNPFSLTCPIYNAFMLQEGRIEAIHVAAHVVYLLLMTVLFFGLSWRRIRKPREKPGFWARWRSRKKRKSVSPRRETVYPDGRNPFYALEMGHGGLTGRRNRRRMLIILSILSVFSLACLYLMKNSYSIQDDLGFLWAFLAMSTAGFLGTVLLANSITSDIETGRMDLLLMTLARPGEIVLGKWRAGISTIVRIWLVVVLVALLMAVRFSFKHDALVVLLRGALFVLAGGLTSVSIGLLASSLVRRTTAAVATALTLGFFYHFGLFLVLIILYESLGLQTSPRTSDALFQLGIFLQPFVAFIASLDLNDHDLLTPYWIGAVAIHVALGANLLVVTAVHFSRTHDHQTIAELTQELED